LPCSQAGDGSFEALAQIRLACLRQIQQQGDSEPVTPGGLSRIGFLRAPLHAPGRYRNGAGHNVRS
jgi:hypothetical protein